MLVERRIFFLRDWPVVEDASTGAVGEHMLHVVHVGIAEIYTAHFIKIKNRVKEVIVAAAVVDVPSPGKIKLALEAGNRKFIDMPGAQNRGGVFAEFRAAAGKAYYGAIPKKKDEDYDNYFSRLCKAATDKSGCCRLLLVMSTSNPMEAEAIRSAWKRQWN